ncbi:MAG: DinB family protein [Bacteroidetes bacterium]|nr:DinB family protein [Bacteroidota bacterium]
MTIQQSVHVIFNQLEDSLLQLRDQQYCQKIDTLSGASIGQHVRHVVEMFVCLQDGYISGIVNYEKRKRDIVIETSQEMAISIMHHINVSLHVKNKQLILEAGFDENTFELNRIPTNYFREIAYNLEHAIHHMALIKIGIREVSNIGLPNNYGVASSTIKYRNRLMSK